MPYTNSQATPRSDIYALVMQANAKFNEMFIGETLFPVKTEDVKRGIYMKANLANAELLNADARPRESGAAYQKVNRKYDQDNYDAQEYGLEADIDDSYEEEVDRFMNLEATEAMLLERSLRISYEQRIVAKVFGSSTWLAGPTNSTAAYTLANVATADVVSDVDAAKLLLNSYGVIPNAVVMSAQVFYRIRRQTLLQNQVFGVTPKTAGQRTLPSEEDVARALGVDMLLVGKAPVNANGKGQAYSPSFIWNNTYVWVGQIEGGEYQAGGAGRTIQWSKDTTGLFTPETYRDDRIRSNVLRVRQHTAEKVIDNSAGTLITTQYS